MRLLRILPLLVLAGCAHPFRSAPEPLESPAPPPPELGGPRVRVDGESLLVEREAEIRGAVADAERRILADYGRFLEGLPLTRGTLQARIGINRTGEVAEVVETHRDVLSALAETAIERLREIRVGPGPEAWVHYEITFEPVPLQVLRFAAELDDDPPALRILARNDAAFAVPAMIVRVTVLASRSGAFKRRIDLPIDPGGQETLSVPIPERWARRGTSFHVELAPIFDPEVRS